MTLTTLTNYQASSISIVELVYYFSFFFIYFLLLFIFNWKWKTILTSRIIPRVTTAESLGLGDDYTILRVFRIVSRYERSVVGLEDNTIMIILKRPEREIGRENRCPYKTLYDIMRKPFCHRPAAETRSTHCRRRGGRVNADTAAVSTFCYPALVFSVRTWRTFPYTHIITIGERTRLNI